VTKNDFKAPSKSLKFCLMW